MYKSIRYGRSGSRCPPPTQTHTHTHTGVYIRNLAVFSVQFELARVTFAVAVGVITAIVLAYVHV